VTQKTDQPRDGTPVIWSVPTPYGYPAAVSAAGSIAAPLLAGFAITLIGIVIQTGSNMRAPGLTLALFAGAVVALLASVQCAFLARLYDTSPAEMKAWWPDSGDRERLDQLVREQADHSARHSRWSAYFRRTYNLGVLLLLAAITVMLMPPGSSHHQTERWLASAIMAIGFCGELAWLVAFWAEKLGPPWYRGSKA
jgi:MFS family permease